ncbi:MAG: hypothetical protein HC923_13455 [Myxococcales bacterium]|nr:hypothetical protein [Myxococcales bacterium]
MPLHLPNLILDDAAPMPRGHFALHRRADFDRDEFLRDRTGANLLHFGFREDRLVASNYLYSLLEAGVRREDVQTVAPGTRVEVDKRSRSIHRTKLDDVAVGEFEPETAACRLRHDLERCFDRLGQEFRGRPIFVALDGQAESCAILEETSRQFDAVTAVTFAMRDARGQRHGSRRGRAGDPNSPRPSRCLIAS